MVAKLHTAAILFGHLGRHLGNKQNYTFEKCFIVFLDPENPTIDTRINVVDTIDVELCVKIYVAANGGQYGRHLENVVSYDIHKYLVVFLDPKNLHLDTKIITVSILEVKINFKKKVEGHLGHHLGRHLGKKTELHI